MNFSSSSRKLTVLFILIAMSVLLTSCDRYARYSVLSFFFDGVPHPDAQPEQAYTEKGDKPARPAAMPQFSHPSRNIKDPCSFCHESRSNMLIPAKDVCIKCHGNIRNKLAYIHPPAAVDCFLCHDVHNGKTVNMIKETGDSLCYNCHYSKDGLELTDKTGTAHAMAVKEKLPCLSCHNPHGGNSSDFIITGAETPAGTDNKTAQVTKELI